MSFVELSKTAAIGAARAPGPGDRAQIDARLGPKEARTASVPGGVSLEVEAPGPSVAATPPVDAERVRQIRAALRDGSYPLVPTKIVDAMIAAQVSLSLPERD